MELVLLKLTTRRKPKITGKWKCRNAKTYPGGAYGIDNTSTP